MKCVTTFKARLIALVGAQIFQTVLGGCDQSIFHFSQMLLMDIICKTMTACPIYPKQY